MAEKVAYHNMDESDNSSFKFTTTALWLFTFLLHLVNPPDGKLLVIIKVDPHIGIMYTYFKDHCSLYDNFVRCSMPTVWFFFPFPFAYGWLVLWYNTFVGPRL